MNQELQEKLYNDFPDLYRGKDLPDTVCRMIDGFCCGDGWYEPIREISKQITELYIKNNVPKEEQSYTFQVKEKFASLRYYMQWSDSEKFREQIRDIISKYTTQASCMCEQCGAPSSYFVNSDSGWILNVCPKHLPPDYIPCSNT